MLLNQGVSPTSSVQTLAFTFLEEKFNLVRCPHRITFTQLTGTIPLDSKSPRPCFQYPSFSGRDNVHTSDLETNRLATWQHRDRNPACRVLPAIYDWHNLSKLCSLQI
nr:unnamed protein product [Callosobruchus chinensis]